VLLAETLPALPAGAASRVKLLPALRNSRSPNWAKEVTWFGGRIAVVLPAGIDSVLLAQKNSEAFPEGLRPAPARSESPALIAVRNFGPHGAPNTTAP